MTGEPKDALALFFSDEPEPPRRRRSRPSLFSGHLVEDGVRRRARREELALAYRLWSRHADIRAGRVKA